jgi:nucleoside-diphosphate-sugar epimerase
VEIICEDQRVRPEKSEVERLLADNSKARELLGWEPCVTLDEGLKRVVEWINENQGQYKSHIYNV